MEKVTEQIQKSSTLPSGFYFDSLIWDSMKEHVFATNWLYIGDERELFNVTTNTFPFFLLDKYLEEPLVLIKEDNQIRCLSNVCTHRGFLLAHHSGHNKKLVCAYHGRRFNLKGEFEFMPEFKEVEDFPRPCDHLQQVPINKWSKFIFTSLKPNADFEFIRQQLDSRLSFLDLDEMTYAPEFSKVYNVQSHWALYVDNYLEGFHIPFVHPTLNALIDYGSYDTYTEKTMVLQTGYADKVGSEIFELPEGHVDHGKNVAAYYFWFYPNFMINVYPWGIQLNVVKPISMDFTKVEFLYYIHDREIWNRMRGDEIGEKTQQEDEWVVEGVQKGLRSRFYNDGRFSVKRESGVHHFHKLLKKDLSH